MLSTGKLFATKKRSNRSSSKKARNSSANSKKSAKTARDEVPVKPVPSSNLLKQSKKSAKTQRAPKPPTVPLQLTHKISIIKELVDEEQIDTSHQPLRRKMPVDAIDTLPSSQQSDEQFKLPRLNLSSQFNSLAVQSFTDEDYCGVDNGKDLNSAETPVPEVIKVKPFSQGQTQILSQVKSLQSATTQFDTQRGESYRSVSSRGKSNSSFKAMPAVGVREFTVLDLVQADNSDEAQKDQLAMLFHSTRVAQSIVREWAAIAQRSKFESEILASQTEQADALNRALCLQKALKSLQRNLTVAKQRSMLVQTLLSRKAKQLKRMTLRKLKEGSELLRAEMHYEAKLICFGMNQLAAYAHQRRLIKEIDRRRGQQLVVKALASWMEYHHRQLSRHNRTLKADQQYSTKLKSAMLNQLRTACRESQASRLYGNQLLFKCYSELCRYATQKQKQRQHQLLVQSFYRCQVAKKILKQLHNKCQAKLNSRVDAEAKWLVYRKRKIVSSLWRALKEKRICHVADLKVARVTRFWLEDCFGTLMAKVWKDFPRQKLQQTPEGRHNLLLNYLSLSKRPRYRQFFTEANTQLRLRLQRLVLTKLRQSTSAQRQFRVNTIYRNVKSVFSLFRKQCQRKHYLTQVTKHLNNQSAYTVLNQTFNALRQYIRKSKSLKHRSKQVQNLSFYNLVSLSFSLWQHLLRKKVHLHHNSALASQIYRTKLISANLKMWLTALKHRLQRRKLERQLQRFYAVKRMSIFKQWRTVYLYRHVQREHFLKQRQLQQFQNLKLVFDSLREYGQRRQVSNFKARIASQQNVYWLGRRVLTQLRLNCQRQQSKQRLLARVDRRYREQRIAIVFRALQAFARYKQLRHQHDEGLTRRVMSLRRATVMIKWHRVFQKRRAVAHVKFWLTRALKRESFKMLQVAGFQSEMLKEKLSKGCLVRVFACWRKYLAWKARNKDLISRACYSKQKRILKCFRTQVDRQKYCNRVISSFLQRVKTNRMKKVMIGLTQNLQSTLAEKNNQRRMQDSLKQSVFAALVRNVEIQGVQQRRLTSLAQQRKLNSAGFAFSLWRVQYLQNQSLVLKLNQWHLRGQTKVLHQLRQYSETKQLMRLLQDRYQNDAKSRSIKKILHHLMQLAEQRASHEEQTSQAAVHYSKSLKRRAVVGIATRVTPLTKLKNIHQQRSLHGLKRRMFARWLARSEARLGRVRACLKIARCHERVHTQQVFQTWHREAQYLQTLARRVIMFEQRCERRAVVDFLKYLNRQATRRCSTNQRLNQVRSKLFLAKKYAIIRVLQWNTKQSQEAKAATKMSCQFASSVLKIKAFRALSKHMRRSVELRHLAQEFRERQVLIVLPTVLFSWHTAYQDSQYCKQLWEVAVQKRKQTLQMQGMKKLLEYTLLRQQRQAVSGQIWEVYLRRMQAKVLDSLRRFCEMKQKKRARRQCLERTIYNVGLQVTCKEAFDGLREAALARQESFDKAVQHREFRTALKSLMALRSNAEDRDILKSAGSLIKAKHEQYAAQKALKKWHLMWLEAQAVNHAQQQYKQRITRFAFDNLRHYQKAKSQSRYARTHYKVVVAVKVLESMKVYRNERRVSKELSILAYQQLSRKLMLKSLRAFAINSSREALIVQLRQKAERRRALRCLIAWDRQLQLKLSRSNAFSNCCAVLMRRQLKHWCTVVQELRGNDEIAQQRVLRLRNRVFMKWQRQTLLNRVRSEFTQSRKQLTLSSLFKYWRRQTSYRLAKLSQALECPIQRQFKFAFDQIFNYHDHQTFLTMQTQRRQTKIQKLNLWLHQDLVKTQLTGLAKKFAHYQLQSAVRTWSKFVRAEKEEEQEVAKLQSRLNQRQYLIFQASLCGGSVNRADLQQMVFKNWRQAIPLLRKQNYLAKVSEEYFEVQVFRTQQRFMHLWINSYKDKRHKNCVRVYLEQQYYDRLARKVFQAVYLNAIQGKQRTKKLALVHSLQLQKRKTIYTLQVWNQLTHYRQNIYRAVQSMDRNRRHSMMKSVVEIMQAYTYGKYRQRIVTSQVIELREKQTKLGAVKALRDYVARKGQIRGMIEAADAYRLRQLALKTVQSLKENIVLQRVENSYSRTFAVFTAWKSLVREQKLLSQYLSECNYPRSL